MFTYRDEKSLHSKFYNGLFFLILFLTSAGWLYALVTFPDALVSSVLYLFLALATVSLWTIDQQFDILKNSMFDIPIDMVAFENFSWKYVVFGVVIGLLFVGISFIKTGPIPAIFGAAPG